MAKRQSARNKGTTENAGTGRGRVTKPAKAPAVGAEDAPVNVEDLTAKRKLVRLWLEDPKSVPPDDVVALALSGGGIRSATYSLGAIQALARSDRNALSRIDIVSSVSGGGYISCFLRSLFMPDEARGIVPSIGKTALRMNAPSLTKAAIADQHRFARKVLRSTADERDIHWPDDDSPTKRRNPLWWLREHSRYLAPNGPTDYGYAAAYIARNWVAMLYIFMVASLAIFSFLIGAEVALRLTLPKAFDWTWLAATSSQNATKCGPCSPVTAEWPVSPAAVLVVPPVLISMILSVAYWMTEAMSPNESDIGREWKNLAFATAGTIVGSILVIVAASWIAPGALNPAVLVKRIPAGSVFVWLLTAGLVLAMLGALTALALALAIAVGKGSLTAKLRSLLTNSLAVSNRFAVMLLALALIDSLGAALSQWRWTGLSSASFGAAVLPALAYLIKKIPDWFGGPSKSSLFSLLQRSMSSVSLVVGLLLFGLVAVAADALVHRNAWRGAPWVSAPDWPQFMLFVFVILVLAVLSGRSSGFINLSSLHSFYAARLTRAYLGASNNLRLEAAARSGRGSNITETHPKDFIQPRVYCTVDLPAPIHIINATINETIDPHSQLVARDRKGDVISVEPAGIRVGSEPLDWSDVGRPRVAEQLSLGQWCAISGAAASSGMGRLTSLGFALAFTFANVRLGYWWWSPGVCKDSRVPMGPLTTLLARYMSTFVYLWNEMTARYSRGYSRKYLTDGGHFENTGVYRLMQRKVPMIIVCDNGADEHYRFEDLENLSRKARLDLGAEIEVLGGADLRSFLATLGSSNPSVFADPSKHADWREPFADPDSPVFALALRARFRKDEVHLIWVKPRVIADLPPDLLGYCASNPQFPQQSTGDQFFDEAQWESYRKLGEVLMSRLLEDCPSLLVEKRTVHTGHGPAV